MGRLETKALSLCLRTLVVITCICIICDFFRGETSFFQLTKGLGIFALIFACV